MDKNKVVDNFLKTNLELHNALEELKVIDKEREEITKLYNESMTISPSLEEKMKKNVRDYENLLARIKEHKNK